MGADTRRQRGVGSRQPPRRFSCPLAASPRKTPAEKLWFGNSFGVEVSSSVLLVGCYDDHPLNEKGEINNEDQENNRLERDSRYRRSTRDWYGCYRHKLDCGCDTKQSKWLD